MLCPAPRCPLNHPISNPTPSPSTQNPRRIIYNSRQNHIYNTFQQRPRMLSKSTPKRLKITHHSSKNAPQASPSTLPGTTPPKAHELRSGGCHKEGQVGSQKSPKGAPERPSDALLWSKAAVVSIAAFKHILKRWLLLFERPDLKNSMVGGCGERSDS